VSVHVRVPNDVSYCVRRRCLPTYRPDPKKVIAAAQEATKLPGAATLVVIECDGTKLRAANLGDSGFRVVRGGAVIFASPAQEHFFNCPFQLGYPPLSEDTDTADDAEVFDVAVAPGDIVILGSDGLFDNVFDEEIASVATAAVASVRGAGALSAARAVSEALAVGGYLFVYMTPRHATHAHVLIKFHTSRRGCPVFPASSRQPLHLPLSAATPPPRVITPAANCALPE